MSEFDLIERFLLPLSEQASKPAERDERYHNLFEAFRTFDDCALISVGDAMLAFSCDTLKQDTHFTDTMPVDRVAYRAMATAFSDLAAANTLPECAMLNLTLPQDIAKSSEQMALLQEGIARFNTDYGTRLIGGDTVQGGQLTLSVTAFGQVRKYAGRASPLQRSEVKPGDKIFCTCPEGSLGFASLRLHPAFSTLGCSQKDRIDQAFYEPKLVFEQACEVARCGGRAAMDISDGLLADCQKLAMRSQVAILVNLPALPINDRYLELASELGLTTKQSIIRAISYGDDYGLLCSIPSHKCSQDQLARLAALGIFEIGQAVEYAASDKRIVEIDRRSMIDCSISDQLRLSVNVEIFAEGQFADSQLGGTDRQFDEQLWRDLCQSIEQAAHGYDHFAS